MHLTSRKARVCVLVKAYPQPSERYEETVCVAGVDLDTGEFLRLYPVPYRRLPPEQQFNRYDVIEAEIWRDTSDQRQESHKLNPDSIRIVLRGKKASRESRVEIWSRSIAKDIGDLERRMKSDHVTLGVVPIDPYSLRFTWQEAVENDQEDKALTDWLSKQASLLTDAPLTPLNVDYSFYLEFQSGGLKRKKRLMDWEAQATYAAYLTQYGAGALEKMKEYYEKQLRKLNPHLFLGTMKWAPYAQLILIGVLRSTIDASRTPDQGRLV